MNTGRLIRYCHVFSRIFHIYRQNVTNKTRTEWTQPNKLRRHKKTMGNGKKNGKLETPAFNISKQFFIFAFTNCQFSFPVSSFFSFIVTHSLFSCRFLIAAFCLVRYRMYVCFVYMYPSRCPISINELITNGKKIFFKRFLLRSSSNLCSVGFFTLFSFIRHVKNWKRIAKHSCILYNI